MNHTANYHLPQWAKTDHLRMRDFNHAMSTIDSGLAENRDKTFDRLCRTACNHLHAYRQLETPPDVPGVFSYDYAKKAVNGMILRDNYRFMGSGTEQDTVESFRANIREISRLSVVKGDLAASIPLELAFSTKAPMFIRDFIISIGTTTGATPSFRLTVTNQNTGEIEITRDIKLTGATSYNYSILEKDYLHGGCEYRLKLVPLDADVASNAYYNNAEHLELTSYMVPDVSLTETVRPGPGADFGLVALHFDTYGSASATLFWDGVEVRPDVVRAYIDEKGRAGMQYLYRRDGTVPEESNLELKLHCEPNGEIMLYSWGAMLI